jgi:hypothetical protein
MCCIPAQINLLQLNPDLEYLRDTLFYQFLGNALIFDDLDSATNYRRSLVARNQPVPLIITMDGIKLAKDGVLNSAAGAGTLPSNLDFVFGSQSFSTTDEYQRIEAGESS